GTATPNRLCVGSFGLSMGLGFVLSFGYWCTDFLVVQRAMAADSMSAARRTPLIAAGVKMFVPFIVILPGLIALSLTGHGGADVMPVQVDALGHPMTDAHGKALLDYDLATPQLLLR